MPQRVMPVTIIPSSPTPHTLPRRRIVCLPCGRHSTAWRAHGRHVALDGLEPRGVDRTGIVVVDIPKPVIRVPKRAPVLAAGRKTIAQVQNQVRTDGRIGVEIAVAEA